MITNLASCVRHLHALTAVVWQAALVLWVGSGLLNAAEPVDFNRDVRPILSNHCFTCHGPDAATREAGLRLDQRDAAVKQLDSGETAIVPGKLATSALLARITSTDADLRMPPSEHADALSAKQITTLTNWIAQGAEYAPHWAFVPPQAPKLPGVTRKDWPRNAIDHFVLARLEAAQLSPAAEASRESLIRRVAFDLTGLPPTPGEIDAFLADNEAKAYERMVDRYLDAPAYGEHMARHWLDLARYADTNGYQYDTEREQWVWRDWVIHAYNSNQPFDQFTIEQLAGDLLPDATPQQRLATGFNRNHGVTIEGGIIDEEYRTEYVMDRLVTSGAVWLGMTVGCARCHDHKYDPLSQKEFYQLYAFFNQVPERGMRGFTPQEKIASPLAALQSTKRQAELAALRAALADPAGIEQAFTAWTTQLASQQTNGWQTLKPADAKSTGGSKLTILDDQSVLAGGANPGKDIYDISARTTAEQITAIRLETLTHKTLPGGGPGRHSNSNFVLSEFELTAVSMADPKQQQRVKFVKATADYSQKGYEIHKTIDGTVANNNGWAVDGPTRKEPATAVFIAAEPFGFADGTELRFRLRHEAGFATHGIGRARLAVTTDDPQTIDVQGVPEELRQIARKSANQRTTADTQKLRAYFLKHHHPHADIQRRIAAIESERTAGFPATMIMQDMPKPRATHILNRGQYNEPTVAVTAGVPAVFPGLPADAPANRLGFAKWLVDPQHPLTARVAVNRYWQRIFGMGLVKTSEDFGLQGELPSHPALLDWLAREFIRTGWDVKQMQRLILTSATYRQSSSVGAKAYQQDPENRKLARGPRLRRDAEEIRDAVLAYSGMLGEQIGGKSVYPYQPAGLWLELNNRPGYSKAYPQGSGQDLYRRSVYTFWKRTVPSPMLKTFDAPEREFCTIRRSRTNTPLQSLLLLNGTQFVEAARQLGGRMLKDGGKTVDEQLTFGFRLITARPPTQEELAILRDAYDADLHYYQNDEAARTQLLSVGAAPIDAQRNPSQWAALTSVARLLLNLDEAITTN